MAGHSIKPSHRSKWLLILLAIPLLGLLAVPPIVLLARAAPATILRYLHTPDVIQAIALSLWTSAASLLITIGFGTPLAYILGRWKFVGKGIVETLIDWPIVLPPAVAGIALLMTLGRNGVIGKYLDGAGYDIPFTPIAVIIAQTFVACPYYIKAASVGFAAINREYLDAAELDGASPWQRFSHVTLPLALRSVVVGAALTWSRALGEFGATIIFAGNLVGKTQTIPLAVYMGFNIDIEQALTLAAVLLVISFGLLIGIRIAYPRA
jgi:molybdate transport system permease protein